MNLTDGTRTLYTHLLSKFLAEINKRDGESTHLKRPLPAKVIALRPVMVKTGIKR